MDQINEYSLNELMLASLDKKNTAPIFKAVKSKDFVPYLVPDNSQQYPESLIDLFNNSALHGAIVRSKADQVKGQGFVWDTSLGQNESMDSFMRFINEDDVLMRISTDYNLYNGFALLVTWTADWSKIGKIEHIDFSKLRAEKVNDEGKVNGYYYCWDWTKSKNEKVYIPVFNRTTASENNKAYKEAVAKTDSVNLQKIFGQKTTQIIYYKKYESGQFYYPLPSYVGAINAIYTDIMSDQYGMSSFENGLNTDVIVTMFGITGKEAQQDEARKFYRMHTGASKSKKPIITFAKDKDAALKVDSISSDKEDKVFTSINENVQQKILSAHRVTDPLLVGIKTGGSLGNTDELKTSIDFWENTVIKPMQNDICGVFNMLLALNELPKVTIKPFEFITIEDKTVVQ